MTTIDTNVLIYYQDTSDTRRRQIAFELITQLEETVLLWQVAVEFVANVRKYTLGGDTQLAWDRLDSFRRLFPLITPTEATLARARLLSSQRQIQYWDALLYAACLDAGVTRLYSEDVPGSPVPGLEIIDPFVP